MSFRAAKSGLDKELAQKAAAKYDKALEMEGRQWMSEVLGGEDTSKGSFHELLKDGTVLVRLAIALKMPSAPSKVSKGNMPFQCMERIGLFIACAKAAGVEDRNNFMTIDLCK